MTPASLAARDARRAHPRINPPAAHSASRLFVRREYPTHVPRPKQKTPARTPARTPAPSTAPAAARTARVGYFARSTEPLHILVFLSPLILAYEVGSALWLVDPNTGAIHETIRAHRLFAQFFGLFGVGGAMLPGVTLVVVMLVWQAISKRPWRVSPRVVGLMAIESAAWTLPLLVLVQMAGLMALATPAEPARSFGARVTIAIGAGLYEELLFRMVAIALLHFLLVDLLQMKDPIGAWLAVALAAVAFAMYHDDWSTRFVFLALAGVYFGGLYVTRGFGVVVGAHALYDLIVLTT